VDAYCAAQYFQLNRLTYSAREQQLHRPELSNIKQVVIGICPLVTSLTHPHNQVYSDSLVADLDSVLTALFKHSRNIQSILHIPYITEINHLQAQRMVSKADDLETASTNLVAPYNRLLQTRL